MRSVSSFRGWTRLFLFSELNSNNWRIPLQAPRSYKLPSSSFCDSIPQGNVYEIITECNYLNISSRSATDSLFCDLNWGSLHIFISLFLLWAAREMWVQPSGESYTWWELQKPWVVVCMQTLLEHTGVDRGWSRRWVGQRCRGGVEAGVLAEVTRH